MPLTGPSLDSPIPIPHLLRAGLARAPDGVALASADLSCTWRDLDRLSNNLATSLLDLGLSPGDRVASLMPNRAILIIHYIACMKAGLVSVPLNYRYTAPEIDRALAVTEASLLVAHRERAQDLDVCHQIGMLRCGLIFDEADGDTRPSLRTLMDMTPPARAFATAKGSDPAFIFFTSGGTGAAKGVTHSRDGISWLFAIFGALLELTPSDVMLAASSISHIGGFGFAFGSLAAGAPAIIPHSFDARHVLPLLREHRPTVLWMQPALLFPLIQDAGALPADFRSLRHCRAGSDKVPAELGRRFTEMTGLMISEGLGMTECGAVTGHPPYGTIKAGSIGQAAPGVRISIRDEAGKELPPGAEGRMFIRTPGQMTGYWADPAATAAVIEDGWLDSGDVVKADEDGYVTFCGRRKQLIIHDGSNISPLEVEDALMQHPALAMAGVVGTPDPMHGENVWAYVVLRPGVPPPEEQELIQFARARVGYKAPEKIQFLGQMPLSNGKIDRAALKRLAVP